MTRENLKNQVSSKIVNDELSEEEMMNDIMQMVDAHVTQQLILSGISSSMADKAQMINALTNTMAVNKKELGCYYSLRDNSLEKLDKLIKSIDI